METIDPRSMAKLDPRGMIGTVYNGTTKHCYIQNIEALGLVVSEKKRFQFFDYQPPGRGPQPNDGSNQI